MFRRFLLVLQQMLRRCGRSLPLCFLRSEQSGTRQRLWNVLRQTASLPSDNAAPDRARERVPTIGGAALDRLPSQRHRLVKLSTQGAASPLGCLYDRAPALIQDYPVHFPTFTDPFSFPESRLSFSGRRRCRFHFLTIYPFCHFRRRFLVGNGSDQRAFLKLI
jgi:hypothetical protein